MGIVDLIVEMDSTRCIKEVLCIGKFRKWFQDSTLFDYIGHDIEHLLNTSIKPEGGIVEIENKFFKYQWVEKDGGGTIYLSHGTVLLDFYEQAISHVSEGIQIFDRNGYFIYSNPASEKLENYRKEDFEGRHLLDLYDLEEEYSTVLTVLRTQKAIGNRCDRFKTSNGKSLTTINSGYPLTINDDLYGAVVFESDFSILKHIRNRTLNLEAYVESRDCVNEDSLYVFDDIIHRSESMKETIHFAKKVSLTNSSILISGDTGTGKELMAQSIHSFSPRRHRPFIDVNCSAIPGNLFESMFFGTEKGAFTGSMNKKGFFEMANGGTLFLDEINSISIEMQAKLLRVLQERRFQKIGGNKYIKCDVRIIAASNEDLLELMEEKKIRRDFYYRIATIKVELPSLKERKEDIPVLAQHFLNILCRQYNRHNLALSHGVIEKLVQYDWGGNIRELQHVIEYAFNFAPEASEVLQVAYLPKYIKSTDSVTHKKHKACNTNSDTRTFKERMEILEKELISDVFMNNDCNVTHSAKILGISRQSLQYRMRKLGIKIK